MTFLILVAGLAFTLQTREGPPDKHRSVTIDVSDIPAYAVAQISHIYVSPEMLAEVTKDCSAKTVYRLVNDGVISQGKVSLEKYGLYATAPGTSENKKLLFHYLVRKPVTKKQQIYDVTFISHIDPGLRSC